MDHSATEPRTPSDSAEDTSKEWLDAISKPGATSPDAEAAKRTIKQWAAADAHTREVTRENIRERVLDVLGPQPEEKREALAAAQTLEAARANDCWALRYACSLGLAAEVRRLIALGLTPDDLRTARALAATASGGRDHVETIDILLDAGLTLDDLRSDDNAALRAACARLNTPMVARLLRAGLGADDLRVDNCAPLRHALARGSSSLIAMLFEAGLGLEDARASQNEGLIRSFSFRREVAAKALLAIGMPAAEISECRSWGMMIWLAREILAGREKITPATLRVLDLVSPKTPEFMRHYGMDVMRKVKEGGGDIKKMEELAASLPEDQRRGWMTAFHA